MRSLTALAAIAIATAVAGSAPANAAWNCDGPAYVCGSGRAATKSTKAAYYVPKAPKRAKHAQHKGKHRNYAAASGSGAFNGKASYYWQPQRVASGGWFNPNAMTAAHKTLPFGTRVRVTNRANGKSVVVTINDRGPYIAGRVIDLSRAAAQAISMTGMGVAPVSVAVLGRG